MARRQLLARSLKSWREDGTQIPYQKVGFIWAFHIIWTELMFIWTCWIHMNIFYYMDVVYVHMNMSICSWLFMKKFKAHITWTCLFAHVNKDNDQNMWKYTTKSLCSYEHFCFSLRIKLTNQEELSLSIDCAFVIDV